MAGRVESLWVKRAHGGPMDPKDRLTLTIGRGIDGNASTGGKREVTLLSLERWREVQREVGQTVDPSVRRANVLLSGLDLDESRGKRLRLGNTLIAIRGETRPCEHMDDACAGLRAALSKPWAGGAFGEVVEDGEVSLGDAAHWEPTTEGKATA